MAYTQDTYLLQATFTEAQIDALTEEGYKAYDRFAEAYLNYSNEEPTKKPGTFTVYGGSYTMKNSEVPVVIDAATTNMTISSVLRDGTYYNEDTSFALTATDFINKGTIRILDESEDDYSVTFTSNAKFTNNNSVSVSNAIFDVANVDNTATFNLTDGAMFEAGTVTNSGTFNLTGDAEFVATTVTNSGTIKLTDAGFGADVANTGAIYVYGQTTEIVGKFTDAGSINYMAGTSSEKKGAGKNKITGDNTINFLTQTDGNRRFFTASDFKVEGTVINIVGTSVSFSGNTTLTADELNVTSYTNETETKTYAGAVKITGRTVGELIAKNVSLNIGNLNGEITLTNVAIEDSTISGEVQGENNASLVMKDAVSISGENVFNADIANSGTLSIAGSETSLEGVQTLTNSGSGKVTINDKAEVTVESIVNKNAGKITVSDGATLKAGSISNKKAGTYVQTIAVEGGTLIAGSVDTTGANFNVTGESTLEIGKVDDAAGLSGTITLGDATLADSFVKGGAVNVEGTVTLSGVNTLSDITNNSSLTLADGATLNASSLTLTAGSSITYNTTAKTINVTGAFDSSEVTSLLQFRNADFTAGSVNAKTLKFVGSDITVNGTLTATTVTVQSASSVNVGKLDGILSLTSNGPTATSTISDSNVNTLDGSKDSGSVEITNNVVFDKTNVFNTAITNKGNATVSGSLTAGAITNKGNLTVAGSLTAKSIEANAVVDPSAEPLTYGTFTVAAPGTKLNTKFTGTIDFADGATLGDSSFGADSVITATNFAIAEGAAVTLTVGEATKLNANISSGTINLVSGFDAETAPEWDLYQLIDGTIGAGVTFTVDGAQAGSIKLGDETYGLIKLDTGLWLTKGQDNETLYINASYAGSTPGEKVDGHIYGYNAFASLRDPALSYSATGVDQEVKAAAVNAKNLVLTGTITDGNTLFYTDQPTVTITTTGEGGASFTKRLYLMHDIIYKKEGDSFVVYDKDGETPIAQAKLPEFILAEGAKLNGGSMLKVGESLDEDDYNTDTGKFTRTAGAVKLTVNGDIKSFIQVNPYSSVTVSETGSVISEYNGTGVTEGEDQQSTYIRVNGSLTVNGDAEAEVKALQFKMQRLTFTDGGTFALNDTNAQFSRIRFYDEGFTIPTGTATITVTNSIVDKFAAVDNNKNNLDDIADGYNFFVYGGSEDKALTNPSKQTVVLTLDNSVMNVSDKATFNMNDKTTVNVTKSTLNVGDLSIASKTVDAQTKSGKLYINASATDDNNVTTYGPASVTATGTVTNSGEITLTGATYKDAEGKDVLVAATLAAGTITNNGAITVTDSTLSATVVDTSAVGATFTVGGTSTLNISGTSSSLTGTITLADDAKVKATIVKGGTLGVAANTAATLVTGSSVASAITNAGTLTLNGVTKTGRITNDGTVNGSASTVGGIINNAGSVTLTGKSFSSVSVKKGTVSLTAEDAVSKAIAVGSITNGTKGTKDAEAIDGSFTANGNVTGSGAITNYAGSINVTGDLTLTQNKTTKVLPAITNGSIYTYNSGNTHIVRLGVGSIEVTGDLTAGNIVNGIENGATEPVDKSFITAANITADSITNYGTIGSQAQGKPHITTLTLEQREVKVGEEWVTTTGALINKKYGEVFATTLKAASIENEGGIDVGAINITSEDGTFENKAGAKVLAGTSIEANAITNDGYLQAGENGTITATALTNGAYVADTEDGYIHAKDITAASIENNGKIVAEGAVTTTAGDITNGTAATTEPEVAAAVEGTINASSIAATGDIVNNAGSVTVSGKISGASISNAGTINADSIEVGKAAVGTTPAVAGYINNSGTIQGVLLTPATEEAPATYGAVAISAIGTASVILNTGSISAVNVTAATVTTNAAGASFKVSGTAASLNISKKLTGTITLSGGSVTAMVKGGTLDVENGSTVSLVGEAGNTAAVTNLGELTITGGVIGAVSNSGTITIDAAKDAAAIQTGNFVNNANANVNVESAFTVKNFTNNGTITIDASKFVLGEDNTVKVISVTGTLTNNVDIVVDVKNLPEGETRQVFVKNDGDDKGVYLFGGEADMTELLVYSDLANEYKPGQSFSFAGHGYVYAVNAFTSANAITQIADNTAYIHFVPQEEAYGNLNLNLSATQDLTVDMINATGRQVVGTFNFNNLIIASEVTEPNDDDEGITAGSIKFVNDVATGTNATVSIAAATAVFEGADFSESKSVTIQEKADVTFGEFSAKAVTIDDSVVFIEDEEVATAISGKATVTNSIVGFSGAASFADAATFTDSTVGFSGAASFANAATFTRSTVDFAGATFTAANTTGKATVTFSGCSDVDFAGDANFTNEDVEGLVNVAITNSTVTFGGKATVEGALTLSGSEVDFAGVSTVGGLLKFTGSTVTVNGSIVAGSTSLDKNSALEIAEGASATLGNTTGNGKINMDVSSTLAFSSDSTFSGTIDVDVTGLTATTTVAPATITGITSTFRDSKLTISGKNASSNWAKYFKYDDDAKTLTLIKEATNVITATGNTNINKALSYKWTGSDEVTYYADNVVIQGGATSTLYLQGNGSYVTLDDDAEYTVGIYGGKYTEATTDRTGVNLGGDINIAIEGGSFTKVVVGGDRINVASGRAVYYREHANGDLASINLTIDGGTFENYVATGVLYQGVNLQGSVDVGSTNLKINGGSFAKDVYGGNYGNKKSSSSCTFVESSNVTLTVGGAEKINMTGCLFVGSFGSGKVETTKLTLAGQSDAADALVVKEIWGGCGSDYNKDDGKGGTTYETAVSGSRTLSFTGFQAAINSRLVSGFSDVEVLSNGLLDEDRFDTKATLQNTVKLSDVENWTFEAGSTLNGAFINDFAGDTLTLKGIGDYFAATELDSWTLFGDTTNFAGFDSFKKDSVKFDGDIARFEEGAWVAGDYKLSIDDESKAMVLSLA